MTNGASLDSPQDTTKKLALELVRSEQIFYQLMAYTGMKPGEIIRFRKEFGQIS